MTTLIGIAANKGRKKGVVLASDLTTTFSGWTPKGDIAIKEQSQRDSKKIYVSNDGSFAVGMAGLRDDLYKDFLSQVLRGKVDMEKVISEGKFDDLVKINHIRMGGRQWNDELTNSLILATRFDGIPKLFTCWPLGLVEERYVTGIGSGSDPALSYIERERESKSILSSQDTSIKQAVHLADDSLNEASSDPYTNGMDMVVVKKDKILEFGDLIQRQMSNARKQSVKEISREL